MDKFVIRKEKVTTERQASSVSRRKSTFSKAVDVSSSRSPRVPQAPFLSSRVSQVNRIIDSSLADPSNPVTHNDAFRRTQHVVSASTGHQQSNGRSSSSVSRYNAARLSKLRAQAKTPDTDILKRVVVYINGYTGTEITNQALIAMIQSAGGQTRPMLNASCTHIVTAMPLSAKKTQNELERRKGGPRIVRPDWILDSIRLGKRQPEWNYSIQESPTQERIPTIFGKGAAIEKGL